MSDRIPPPSVADRLTKLFWRKPVDDLGETTRRRVVVYLIPFLFFLYILAYLDRVNVSVAALGMIVFGSIYPVVVIACLTRRGVKAAFSAPIASKPPMEQLLS